MKPTPPGSLSHIFAFAIYFYLLLFLDLLIQKTRNTLLHFILFAIYLSNLLQPFYRHAPISGTVTRKGLTTPLTRRVGRICYLCAGAINIVLLGSPTSSITLVSYLREIPTAAVLHHPFLIGEIPRSFKRHQKEFLAPLPGRIFNIYQVPNHKSPCNLHYLPFASSFPLPHFTKNCRFIRPLFRSPFSCRICF